MANEQENVRRLREGCAWRSRQTGNVTESPMAHFFKFRDGSIIDVLELFDTAKAIAARSL